MQYFFMFTGLKHNFPNWKCDEKIVQGVYACIDGDITEDPRRQTGAKLNAN